MTGQGCTAASNYKCSASKVKQLTYSLCYIPQTLKTLRIPTRRLDQNRINPEFLRPLSRLWENFMNHKERKVLHLAIITPEKEYDNDAKGVSRLVLHLPHTSQVSTLQDPRYRSDNVSDQWSAHTVNVNLRYTLIDSMLAHSHRRRNEVEKSESNSQSWAEKQCSWSKQQSSHRDPKPQRKWGWGSYPRKVWAVARYPLHQHHQQSQWQSQLRDLRGQQKDRHRVEQNP